MPENKNQTSLVELQQATLDLLSLLRDDIANTFAAHKQKPSRADQTLRLLFRYLMDRCNAVLFLASHSYAWDAEIVLRSFYETAAKILFISFSPEDVKDRLMTEFWNDLGAVANRRQSRKASYTEALHRAHSGEVAAEIFRSLQDEQKFATASDKSRADRKIIEKKWSFTGLIESLNEVLPGGAEVNNRVFLHSYGLASHLLHADHRALDLMLDRSMRPKNELRQLEAAHGCRIHSDLAHLGFLCVLGLRRHFGIKDDKIGGLKDALERVEKLTKPHFDAFYDDQRSTYGLSEAVDTEPDTNK